MIGIPVAIVWSNALEWGIHKYMLHGLGKDRRSFWSFHWHEHHKNARKSGHRDIEYEREGLHWNGPTKEAVALGAAAVVHLPLAPVAPFFVGTMLYCAGHYWWLHRKAHLDPEWAREHLPWHYDHHMGPDQDANWCVTRPWFDDLLGTRKPYVGTETERRDLERRAARQSAAEASTARAA